MMKIRVLIERDLFDFYPDLSNKKISLLLQTNFLIQFYLLFKTIF